MHHILLIMITASGFQRIWTAGDNTEKYVDIPAQTDKSEHHCHIYI